MFLPTAALVDGELRALESQGWPDAAARASEIWKKTLEEYEQPSMDDGLREQLEEYVTRRRTELGD